MKDYRVKAGSILKFTRFDPDDYKKTDQGIEKTDDYAELAEQLENSENASMPTAPVPCSLCCREWIPAAKTGQSSTSRPV